MVNKTISENQLAIDQESFKLLVDSVEDLAIYILNAEGIIITWNEGARQIEGYEPSEVIGKKISMFYTPEDVASGVPEKNLDEAMKKGHHEVEGWRVRKGGNRFWANVLFTAIKDADGKLVGFGKMTRDVSENKLREDQMIGRQQDLEMRLHKSESEIGDYKHALDEFSIVAITDQKGIIKYVNDNFCRISKYSRQELLGQDHRIINSKYHEKSFFKNLWVTIANGKIWRGEIKNRAKDGTYYWVDTTIVPFLNSNGKPYQYLAVRTDITPRKIAEAEVLRMNESLERKVTERTLELTEALEREKELSDMKSRFVSLASHEFRTPLSAILSSISLIEHYITAGENDKSKKHIERAKTSVHHLTAILDDFLSLDKLEQGKVEVQNTQFNIKDLLEDAIAETSGMVRKKNQFVHLQCPDKLELNQDKKILRNVLLNLLSNASKYSTEEKKIYIKVQQVKEQICISIKDEGLGIPLEAQKDLFSKFFRAKNVSNIQGTGLGLHIVGKYVELIKGTIQFTSKENVGSTFLVCIPTS